METAIVATAPTALGTVVEKSNIRSSLGPFLTFPDYRVQYPEKIVRALGTLYREYNRSFGPLVEMNREWEGDYRYCFPNSVPINYAVQVDMTGLPDELLTAAVGMSDGNVEEVLRDRIFEIENSLAMYQFLLEVFPGHFKGPFQALLASLRGRYGMPIALLAVTDQKYQSMRESEFGKSSGDILTDDEVKKLSGFDKFFSPSEFQEYLATNGGECGFLLYARTSDPIAKLRQPSLEVEHPLLGEAETRKIIKEYALTFNVDAPRMAYNHRINDTKEYLPPMRMAFPLYVERDLYSYELTEYLSRGKPYLEFPSGNRLSPGFADYLESRKIDPDDVDCGRQFLRFKPMKGAYGCYGHIRGSLAKADVRKGLRKNLQERGAYVVQPEMQMSTVVSATGKAYSYIDRNFLGFVNDEVRFLGGFRSFLEIDSEEVKNGRNHGNRSTIYAAITV